MKLEIELLNERKVERELLALAKEAGVQGRKFADEAAAVGMKALVRRAQPYGLGGKAKKQGEKAVRRDVGRAFDVVPNGARGRGIVRTVGAAAAHHRSVRNSRGRVSRGARKVKILASVFFQYIRLVQARVGRAKGAFSTAGMPLGVKGIQKWISRSRKEGKARRRGRRGNVAWHLHATPEHVTRSNVLGERGAASVLRSSERNLRKSFEARIKRRYRAAEKRVNG